MNSQKFIYFISEKKKEIFVKAKDKFDGKIQLKKLNLPYIFTYIGEEKF